VIATANGGDGRELLRRLGADEAVDTQHDDIVAAARRLAPSGIDALLALAGGPDLERCIAALREGATIAHPNGVVVPGGRGRAFDGVPTPQTFTATIEAAPIHVPIAATYSLDDAAEAHRRLERGHVLGKIVLVADAEEAVEAKVA
jgi:NADPH:quinone reductase-like Zn-dependent oxidoreductase